MSPVHGGHLVMRTLKQEGVEHIFGIAAVSILPLWDACLDVGVRNVDTRHEAAAVHMADGWARATGTPGFAAVTSGPGLVNALTGIITAYECSSPLVVLTSHTGHATVDRGALHDIDQMSLLRPYTKWAATCYDTRRLPEYITTALRHAMSGRPGPTVVQVAGDVLGAAVEEEEVWYPSSYRNMARPTGDAEQVRAAAELLARADRPVVIAGSGVWWFQASKELQDLIETGEFPLVLAEMGRGAVREDHPLCFGPNRVGVRQADVVLVMGTRLNYQFNYGQPPLFDPDVKVIQVDIHPEEIGRNRNIDIGIHGDAKAVLEQLTAELGLRVSKGRTADWLKACRDYAQGRRQEMEPDVTSDSTPIHPPRLCNEIEQVLDRNATVVMDGGEITVWGPQVLRVHEPGHWMDNGPFGCLGVGTSYAIASKLAHPDEQVLLLSGDGAFGFNAMEYDTAIRHNIPFVGVVSDNGWWAMESHPQEAHYGADRQIGTHMGTRPYDKIVEAMGGHGEFVERPEDLQPALRRAFASGKPACVNVVTDVSAVPGRRARRQQQAQTDQ